MKWLVLLVNLWAVGGMEFRDTMESVPPLFELQDWSRCQRPQDVYCVLDAALVSGNDTVMQLIKEYSALTTQHFNRSLVHRGVCATRCGAGADGVEAAGAAAAAQACVNTSLKPYGFEAQFDSLPSLCVSPGGARSPGGALALVGLAVALVVLAGLATAADVVTSRLDKECSKFVLAFSLRRNWQILTYDRSKPRSDQRMKGVACMEGVRALGIQCVIFAHVLLVTGTSFLANPQFLEHMYETFMGQAAMNSPVWLQAFFCLSGFLSAYSTLVGVEASPFTPLKALVAVVNRWIRLTPIAGIMLWFTISWLPRLGSSPLWAWYVTAEAEACSERWWYHLLYVHNHLPLNKLCMGHTWYLAVDMQLHILGMLLLLVLVRCRRAALPTLLALLVGSAVAAGLVVYWYQLTPIITAQSPEDLRTLFSKSKILPYLYIPMWMNMGGYVCGMGAAFAFYEIQSRGIKLRESKWFNMLFHLSIPLGTCVVLNGVWFLRGTPPHWSAVLYASLDRPLVALCFAVFMLGCVSKCKFVPIFLVARNNQVVNQANAKRSKLQAFLRTLFAWRGFHTFGRLSYCVFLVHFVILRILVTGNPQLGNPSMLSLLSLLITASALSHIIAIPLCLLAELPAIEFYKALTEKKRVPAVLTPLDLVDSKRPEQLARTIHVNLQ